MCKYGPECPLAQICQGTPQFALNETEIAIIIDTHNKIRNKVALGRTAGVPKAADMCQLEWNNELAAIAQCWANQCEFKHDVCRDIKKGWVGQNIARHGNVQQSAMADRITWSKLMGKWYDEYKNFKNGNYAKFAAPEPKSGPTGHFTQLVWGKTQYIGCGRTFYRDVIDNRHYFIILLVCNYFPGGNTLTLPIYTVGKPVTKCPVGTAVSDEYKGLCKANS
ncbi:venom allergen 3-like [Chrysoperla carnea]|uniref:venom allergen 3-like n=1 Tax=Chrysoperla carnea TaxID=189513 RepID=UPI001D06B16F|nr:venom allergen 3-like [Chrysoperla carnea]